MTCHGEEGATEEAAAEAQAVEEVPLPMPANVFEAQVELHRRGFSCGSIDGVPGAQTAGALRAFQRSAGLRPTGLLDTRTREALRMATVALKEHEVSPVDLGGLEPVPKTWLEKSERERLGYATVLEALGERYHANPKILQQLNPDVDWAGMLPGAVLTVPAADEVVVAGEPAEIVIGLSERELEVLDAGGRVIAHFPVSIAKMAEKRPVGELHVTVVIPNPDYTFNPAVFPESAEARSLGRKLILPPGPNNPVGLAWVGLDRPGYGMHGTPEPEQVGRTESHGCFRLANWDAVTLLRLVRVGMKVVVVP